MGEARAKLNQIKPFFHQSNPNFALFMSTLTKLAKACDACKQKKIKCNSDHPICSHCKKHNLPCHYRAIKKPGLKTGYAKQMSERVEELDTVVGEMAFVREYRLWIESIGSLRERVGELERRLGPGLGPGLGRGTSPGPGTGTSLGTALDLTPGRGPARPEIGPTRPDSRHIQLYMEEIHHIFPILHPIRSIPPLVASISTNPLPTVYGIVLCLLVGSRDISTYNYCKKRIMDSFNVVGLESLRAMSLLCLKVFMEGDMGEFEEMSQLVWAKTDSTEGRVSQHQLAPSHSVQLDLGQASSHQAHDSARASSQASCGPWIVGEEHRYIFWNFYALYSTAAILQGKPISRDQTPPTLLPLSFDISIANLSTPTHDIIQTRTLFNSVNGNMYDSMAFTMEMVHKNVVLYEFLTAKTAKSQYGPAGTRAGLALAARARSKSLNPT